MSEKIPLEKKAVLYCKLIEVLLDIEKSLTETNETDELLFSKDAIRLLNNCFEFLTNYVFVKRFQENNQENNQDLYINIIRSGSVFVKNIIDIFNTYNILDQESVNNIISISNEKFKANKPQKISLMYKDFCADLKVLLNDIHYELLYEVELLNNGQQIEDVIKSVKNKSEKIKISPLQKLHENNQAYT